MRKILIMAACSLVALGCQRSEAPRVIRVSPSEVRAGRRAYEGAPPTIPHAPLSGACGTCHATEAKMVPGIGLAPPNPHLHTAGMSAAARCLQCHVFQTTVQDWRGNTFQGLSPGVQRGQRQHPLAPPTIPHPLFLRESCASCHIGEAARPELRCSHPERALCGQCHVPDNERVVKKH